MATQTLYNLFISHAWKYSDDYYRLVNLLDKAHADTKINFQWKNYSVPVHDPAIDPNTSAGKKKLTEALDAQMKPTSAVLIISGMYASYSDWIQTEIQLANNRHKPIIGLIPWGQERNSKVVQDAAKEMVGWNTSSIIAAIEKYALTNQ